VNRPVQIYYAGVVAGEPKTRRGRESRDRILERAAELVAEHGLDRLTLEEVQAAAGVSKSQLYHYFADRDELVEAVVALRCEQVAIGLRQAFATVSTVDELEGAVGGFVAAYEQQPAACPIGSLASSVADRHEGARLRTVDGFATWEGLYAAALERMRERGELRADASPTELATALLASIEGGLLLSQTRRDPRTLRVAVDAALAHIRSHTA
jgi:TetR/AcrR family transcriptional regulator, transcriptional repressor for nem operon